MLKGLLIQFINYFWVGGIAALFDIAVFHLCNEIIGWHYFVAKILAFVVGVLINYFLSLKFVFNAKASLKDFISVVIIGISGLVISLFLLDFLVVNIRIMPSFANVIVIGIVFVWNFAVRRFFVYNKRNEN